jgi:hypothetical protein
MSYIFNWTLPLQLDASGHFWSPKCAGPLQTWKGATHREKTLYWILGKLFSNTLPASRSITHKRVDAENIGFLHHSIDLDMLIKQEDLSNNPFMHLNIPGMYILYRVCSGYCNLMNQG